MWINEWGEAGGTKLYKVCRSYQTYQIMIDDQMFTRSKQE